MDFWKILSNSKQIRRTTPAWIKSFIRRHFTVINYDKHIWAQSDPFKDETLVSTYEAKYPFTFGIIKEFKHDHQYYVAACREIGVSYKLLDISGSDWIEVIEDSGCDAFLVWPASVLTIWKQMNDERLRIMVEDLGKIIYPSYKELWIYEGKRRMRDWLMAHKIPHPKTEIFYDLDQALDFLNQSKLPLVMKTNQGASSHGVIILKEKRKAKRIIRKVFNKGIVAERGDPRDRQWGSVILQEYLPDVKEWRMVRIGASYFGHPKGKIGEFHSGSGKILWDSPPVKLLDFLRHVTDTGNFTSMNVDVFETVDGRYMVNELQTVFGASYSKDQLRVNGKTGRYIYHKKNREWIFEEGDFARNACANLRIECLIKILSGSKKKQEDNEYTQSN